MEVVARDKNLPVNALVSRPHTHSHPLHKSSGAKQAAGHPFQFQRAGRAATALVTVSSQLRLP